MEQSLRCTKKTVHKEGQNPKSLADYILANHFYFKAIVKRHRLDKTLEAEDIIHDILLAILEGEEKGKYTNVNAPKQFLNKLFRNVLAMHTRQQTIKIEEWDESRQCNSTRNTPRMVSLDEGVMRKLEMQPVMTKSETIGYIHDARKAIKLAEEVLNDRMLEVFQLKVLHGMKLNEIAVEIGINPNNAKQIYNRAKAKLRKAALVKKESNG